MKPTIGILLNSILLAATMAVSAQQFGEVPIPERFGLVDIIPVNQSSEANQNSEPSLGVAVGTNYGEMVVHAFTPTNYDNFYYTGGPPWTNSGQVRDGDTTLDWSTGGTCYMASLFEGSLKVRKSSNPASVTFTVISGATVTAPPGGSYPDQPWISVVNVSNQDHIFVGYNNLTESTYFYPYANAQTASIRYSLDGGTHWSTAVIEKATPGVGQDSPAVRLAISADGSMVYALFQRLNSWTGTAFGSDALGDIVLMRDDSYGGSGYAGLGDGTLVAHNIVIPSPGGTSLGAERLGAGCAIAINPTQPKQVYVAYTETVSGAPVLRVQSSINSGASFSLVYSISNASLPALAVAQDGTVGLLYAKSSGGNLEVDFSKVFTNNFISGISTRALAIWPNNKPITTGNPYIGDFFTLKAVGYNFYGTFSASDDPKPAHFPSGVFYQRDVKVGGTTTNFISLSTTGTLVDHSGNPVASSIDPFVFYDIAPSEVYVPVVEIVLPFFYNPIDPYFDPSDPYSSITHVIWPVLPINQPQLQLQVSPSLGLAANWADVSAVSIVQANGAFGSVLDLTQSAQFYRLRRDLTGAQFNVFAAADANGQLNVTGVVNEQAGTSQTFTATPASNYAVDKWYVDGAVVQSNRPSLTLSNITDEHTVLATFIASNDLAVTIAEFPPVDGPTVTFSSNSYVINIENVGLNTLTGISMSNSLPPTVGFISATTTQGTVNNNGNAGVIGSIGTLNPGASATVTINFQTSTAGSITDTVNVACSQFEPDLSNNTATAITFVYDPVVITSEPASQIVPIGSNTFFSVGVSGTPPFLYQWFFNGAPIDNATNPTITLTGVTAAQAGSYSVSVYQMPAPEDVMEADSVPATLTIGTNVPTVQTFGAINIGTNGATLEGEANGNNVGTQITVYFQYGLDPSIANPTDTAPITGPSGYAQDFGATVTGLSPGTTYYYRIIASNDAGLGIGAISNFTTAWSPVPPTLISPGATTSDGAPTLTNLTPIFTWNASSQAASSDLIVTKYPFGSANVVATLGVGTLSSIQMPAGILQPETLYEWHMISFNNVGDESAPSSSLYFWTPAAPIITTLAATNILSHSATLQGFVNPAGAGATAWFEYGTTTGYGNTTTPTFIGALPQNFNANITGLASGTLYHFRIDATNIAGASLGLDNTFSTP